MGRPGCRSCPDIPLGIRGGCSAACPALPVLPGTATEPGQLFLTENCALSSGEGASTHPPTLLLIPFQQNATLTFLSAPGREQSCFQSLTVGLTGLGSPAPSISLFLSVWGFLTHLPGPTWLLTLQGWLLPGLLWESLSPHEA